MKKFILGFICGLLLMGTTFAATELNVVPNPFPVFIDGVQAAVEGYNINGFTYLKLADFKQAGLTVKFNETDRQIEITKANSSTEISENIQTPETTVPIITPPVEESEPQGVITEEDGLKYLTISNTKYVDAKSISEKLDSTPFTFYVPNRSANIVNRESGEILLPNIPIFIYKDTSYIEYEYFKANIIPFLSSN